MKKLPVGIQLFGLRTLLENKNDEFENVMTAVKKLGYDGVELAGMYGLEPAYIRDVLEKTGLEAISAHVDLMEAARDMDKMIDDYRMIGVKYLVIPFLLKEYRPGAEKYTEALDIIRKFGVKVKAAGMTLMYHNHNFEFLKLEDGSCGYDDIYKNVSEEVLSCEPDTCWIKVAGENPVEYLKKYGNRNEVVHLKDFYMEGDPRLPKWMQGIEDAEDNGVFALKPVGFGQQMWEPILETVLEIGSKYVIVEQDDPDGLDPMEAARRSREYLRILGW